MPRYRLTIEYDGSPFVGWQRQAEGLSIQGLIEDALSRIEGRAVAVVGAGRTDAGVHACGQVASVRLSSPIDLAVLERALNAMLPAEIRVTGVEQAADSFHARYSAESKTYRYRIVNAPSATPFEWRYAWHVTERLDVERMRAAARLIEGEHDFAAFRATGSSVKTTVRRVERSSIVEDAGSEGATPWGCAIPARPGARRLTYEVSATGFLRHMVRAIVGTLVEIGTGRREAASIEHALASGDRADAGPTAPACGLCLVEVRYPSCDGARQPVSS